MQYILTVTARRKNGKRHIEARGYSIPLLIKESKFIDRKRYNVEIYTARWEKVQDVTLSDLQFM